MTTDKIIVLSYFLLILIIGYFAIVQFRKRQEIYFASLMELLGVNKMHVSVSIPFLYDYLLNKNLPVSSGFGLYAIGIYKGRKVNLVVPRPSYVSINTIPNIIPKKIPWHTLYSKVYKEYQLTNSWGVLFTKDFRSQKIKSSSYEARIILDDLIHACEMVERGDYKL